MDVCRMTFFKRFITNFKRSKQTKMKLNPRYMLLFPFVLIMFSCKSGFEYNKAGFEKINSELVGKFGAEAYYTDLELVHNTGSDEAVMVTETNNPSSMKQEQWLRYSGGEWEKQADVSFTAEGADPKLFMFQLNKDASLSEMGDLLQTSKDQLLKEKNVAKPVLTAASIRSYNKMNSKDTGIFYYITLQDADTKKDYHFVYDLKGQLKSTLEN
jgi:hypothetical protein